MIMGILATVAGPKLAKHLANLKDNLSVSVLGHGVDGASTWDALADIRIMGLGSKTKKPGFHIWASPSIRYTELEWELLWYDLETEFGLAGQPYVEVEHIKIGEGGRHYPHRHRVYCRVLADGKVARDSNSGARIQKIARLSELRTGEIMTRGAFDEAIFGALEKEGRQDEAQRIRDGFRLSPPPQRFVKSKEVAEARRLDDLPSKEVVRRAYEAWVASHDGPTLARALELRGLRICLGDKGRPLVVTPGGAYRRLAALINSGGSDKLKGAKPRMADLLARVGEFPLRPVEEVIAEVRASRADLGQIVKSDKVGRRDTAKIIGREDARETALTHAREAQISIEIPRVDAASVPPSWDTNHEITGDEPIIVITAAQEAALRMFDAAIAGGAAEAVQKRYADAKQRMQDRAEQPRPRRRLPPPRFNMARLAAITDSQMPDPREIAFVAIRPARRASDFKADLAGVRREVGELLWWVDPGDDRRRIHLRSGAILTAEPEFIATDTESMEAIEVILAYAERQGWGPIELTGGSSAWRELMAIEAGARGFVVVNADVAELNERERERREWSQIDDDRHGERGFDHRPSPAPS